MSDNQTQENAVETTARLPEPPEYECPYDPDSSMYEHYQESGYYGVMYAGEYKWDNLRCTAEAYGEYDPNARPGNRRKTRDGKPLRSLKFHTTWMDTETAAECLREIGDYNRFDGDVIAETLAEIDAPMNVSVGREGSPAVYLWTLEARSVYETFEDLTVEREAPDVPERMLPGNAEDGVVSVGKAPDEIGMWPNADTFPSVTVDGAQDRITAETPTLIRMWWD